MLLVHWVCVTFRVVDTSALITLAGADALGLLRLPPHQPCAPPEVFQEAAEAGLAQAFPDALKIRELFDRGHASIRAPRRRQKIEGVSVTDSLVILLAEELGAADLLANDRGVLRKAEQRGLPASLSVEFVQDLFEQGNISRKRRDALFACFLARGRHTEEFVRVFLLGR